jgi:hypothetical protein
LLAGEVTMNAERTRWDIDSSRVPVDGIGGLGLLAMVVVMALTLAPLGELALMAVAGGGVIALVLLFAERRHHRGLATVLLSALAVLAIVLVANYRPFGH